MVTIVRRARVITDEALATHPVNERVALFDALTGECHRHPTPWPNWMHVECYRRPELCEVWGLWEEVLFP